MPEKRKEIIILFLILALAFIIRIPFLEQPLDRDSGLYSLIGKSMNNGVSLYKDVQELKPPGIFFIFFFLFKFFKPTLLAVNLAITCWTVLTTFLIYILAKMIFNKNVAYISSLLFAIFSSSPFFNGANALTENFMIAFNIAAFYFFFISRERQNNRFFLFISGIFFGLGFLFKQVALFDFTAVAVYLFLIFISTSGKNKAALFFKQSFFLSLGFLTPFILSVFYFLYKNSLNEYIFCLFTLGLKYSKLLGYSHGDYLFKFFYANLEMFKKFSLLFVFGLIFVIFTLTGLIKKRKEPAGQVAAIKIEALLSLWAIFSFLGICLSGRFFPHYYIALLPVICIMTGWILFYVWEMPLLSRYSNFFVIIFLIISLSYSSLIHYKFYFVYNPDEVSMNTYPWQPFVEAREVGFYIKEHSQPDDYVYIWAEEPQILFYADRRSSSLRYWDNIALVYFAPILKDASTEVFSSLQKNKPKYIVIDTRHIGALSYYRPMGDFFQQNYFVEAEFKVIRHNVWGYSLLVCRLK